MPPPQFVALVAIFVSVVSGFHLQGKSNTKRSPERQSWEKTICDVATPILSDIADAMRDIQAQLAEQNLVLRDQNWTSLDAARSRAEDGLERLLALAKGSVHFLYCRDEENEIRENHVGNNYVRVRNSAGSFFVCLSYDGEHCSRHEHEWDFCHHVVAIVYMLRSASDLDRYLNLFSIVSL